MAIDIITLINRLDLLYGNSYTALNTALGVTVNDYNSAKQLTSDAKAIARGGSDRYGVVADANALKVVAFASPTYACYVNSGNVYFNGVSKSVPTIVVPVGNTDNSGITFDVSSTATHSCFAAYISCRDGSPTPTVAVTKGYYSVYGLGGATGIAPLPTIPRGDIPLAQIIAQRSIPTGIPYVTDIRPKYEVAPSDDQITTLFSGFNTVEDTIGAKTFRSDFTSAINALNVYTVAQTGQTLKNYTATYSLTEGFKQLYADNYNEDLYTPLLLAAPSIGQSTVYNKKLYSTNLLDAITQTATWTATVQLKVWAVCPTNSYVTAFVNTSDTTIYLQNTNGFDAPGDAAIYNYDGSFDMISYTGKTATSLTTVSRIDNTHRSGDSIYGVSNLSVYIPVASTSNNSYSIGTSTSRFYSVIQASYINDAYHLSRIQIRNH